ncbi:MAG: hypothetical protein KAT11_07140, partial [Phycisphaerae bacterium]|nr:hypothetical protein [Phycisphaerae bacterium]
LKHKIFAQVPDDWRTVSRSINAGDPLALYAPNSKIRTSLVDLAMRLAGNDPSSGSRASSTRASRTGHSDRASSLLGRMFRKATERNRGGQKNFRRSLTGVVSGKTEERTNR